MYVKQELQPKRIFEDKEGRYLAVEIKLEGKRTLVAGVYAPNGPKEKWQNQLANLDGQGRNRG